MIGMCSWEGSILQDQLAGKTPAPALSPTSVR